MQDPKSQSEQAATVCKALAHPLRLRILEALHEGPRSPVQFVQDGLFPAQDFASFSQALSVTSYHFRALMQAGCVEVAETIQRRGATEHVYRSLTRVEFTDEEFAALEQHQREELSRSAFQGLVARADTAMRAGTFDSRSDRSLVWMPLALDPEGWDELSAALQDCFTEIEQIKANAQARLDDSGEPEILVTVGLLGFESPPPPAAPQRDPK